MVSSHRNPLSKKGRLFREEAASPRTPWLRKDQAFQGSGLPGVCNQEPQSWGLTCLSPLYLEGLSSLFFQSDFLGLEQIRSRQLWFYTVCLSTYPAHRSVWVTSFQLLGERELCLASLSSLQIAVLRRNGGPIISALLVRMRKGLVGWAVTPEFVYCSKRMLNRFLILKDHKVL